MSESQTKTGETEPDAYPYLAQSLIAVALSEVNMRREQMAPFIDAIEKSMTVTFKHIHNDVIEDAIQTARGLPLGKGQDMAPQTWRELMLASPAMIAEAGGEAARDCIIAAILALKR